MRINHFIPSPRFTNLICYPESFGHYADEPSHSENRTHGLSTYNWHIVRGGKGYIQVGETTLELGQGTGFLCGPGVPQRYYADQDEPWDIRWVHFTAPGLSTLLQGRGEREAWVFSWEGADRLDRLWSDLLATGLHPLQEGEARLSAMLYEMLAEFIMYVDGSEERPQPGMRTKLMETAQWIRTHSHQPLTLEQMASQAEYSPSHFSRQFHGLFGKTPIEFLNECRILQSKSLLISTGWTVKKVAETVGFASSTYFIQRFRKNEGMTPEQFRELRGVYVK